MSAWLFWNLVQGSEFQDISGHLETRRTALAPHQDSASKCKVKKGEAWRLSSTVGAWPDLCNTSGSVPSISLKRNVGLLLSPVHHNACVKIPLGFHFLERGRLSCGWPVFVCIWALLQGTCYFPGRHCLHFTGNRALRGAGDRTAGKVGKAGVKSIYL